MSRTARPYEPTTPAKALQSLLEATQTLLETTERREADSLEVDAAMATLRQQLDTAIRTRVIHHRNQSVPISVLSGASTMSPASISLLHQQYGHRISALVTEENEETSQ